MKILLPPAGVALAAALLLIGGTAAAAPPIPASDRSTPGTVLPSTGTTVGTPVVATPASAPRSAAGSFSASKPDSRCAELRRRYAQSQSCFSRFRLQNGGLRPGAAKSCKEIPNPSLQCGSEVVP